MAIAKLFSALFLTLVLVGCASPEARIYRIHLPPAGGAVPSASAVPLALWVEAPKHLSQPYITTRISPYEVEVSRSSKWESSPEVMVREELVRSFSAVSFVSDVRVGSRPPSDHYFLRIYLRRFERAEVRGVPTAELAADVSLVSPGGTEIKRASILKSVSLRDSSYVALAEGLSTALSQAIVELASFVRSGIESGTTAK